MRRSSSIFQSQQHVAVIVLLAIFFSIISSSKGIPAFKPRLNVLRPGAKGGFVTHVYPGTNQPPPVTPAALVAGSNSNTGGTPPQQNSASTITNVQDMLHSTHGTGGADPLQPAGRVTAAGVTAGGALSSSSSSLQAKPGNTGNGINNDHRHYPHVDMKGFWQSLRTWSAFKRYCHGIKDLILIAKPVERFLLHTGTLHDRDLSRFIGKAVSFMVYSVIITSVLGTLGIDTKPLITGIGISGFVVGFALKEIATNTLAGILLVVQRPFRTGWKIKVGSHNGVVLSIDSHYVRLQTDDGQQILLPSYQVYSAAITVVEKTDKYGRPVPSGFARVNATATTTANTTPPSS